MTRGQDDCSSIDSFSFVVDPAVWTVGAMILEWICMEGRRERARESERKREREKGKERAAFGFAGRRRKLHERSVRPSARLSTDETDGRKEGRERERIAGASFNSPLTCHLNTCLS